MNSGYRGRCSAHPVHPCFHDAEVSFFLGKNPWQSHGFPRSRNVLNEIARDPQSKNGGSGPGALRDRRQGGHPPAVEAWHRRLADDCPGRHFRSGALV